jgi:hypothetical protein
MAGGQRVSSMAPAIAQYLRPEREGAWRGDAPAPTVRPGELGDADARGPETARLQPRRALGSIATRLRRGNQRLAYFLKLVPPRLRVAIEFRNPTWHQDPTFALLEEYGAAYCVMSGARLPCVLRATAQFVYVRLHGPDQDHMYGGSYSEGDLRWWRDRILEWQGMGRDVFVYFNNDAHGHAVHNAVRLKELIGC